MDYEFDLYTNDAVQKKLATITDDELLGSDAQVTVVVVDLFETKADEGNGKQPGKSLKELLQQQIAGRHVHLQQSKDRRVSR